MERKKTPTSRDGRKLAVWKPAMALGKNQTNLMDILEETCNQLLGKLTKINTNFHSSPDIDNSGNSFLLDALDGDIIRAHHWNLGATWPTQQTQKLSDERWWFSFKTSVDDDN